MAISRIVLTVAVVMSFTSARADEVRLLSTLALHSLIDAAVKDFEKSGHHVRLTMDTGPNTRKRASNGEPFDLIFVTPKSIEQLTAEGKLKPGPIPAVTSPLAIGFLEKSRIQPTVEAFKAALLKANAIGMGDYKAGLAGAVNSVKAIEMLGLANDVIPKIRIYQPGNFPKALTSGEVDYWMTQAPELVAVADKGVAFELLPEAVQTRTVFTIGIAKDANDNEGVKQFLAYIASASFKGLQRDHGLTPP
jgi:ABC-type molybdate transport system substrate-binding protein